MGEISLAGAMLLIRGKFFFPLHMIIIGWSDPNSCYTLYAILLP